jgi:hypothetical protein
MRDFGWVCCRSSSCHRRDRSIEDCAQFGSCSRVESWFKSHQERQETAPHSFQRLRATFSRLSARKIAPNHWKAAVQAGLHSDG